jgi:hypothetical protein
MSIWLLHHYGVDVVYDTDDGTFARDNASELARNRMMPLWISASTG